MLKSVTTLLEKVQFWMYKLDSLSDSCILKEPTVLWLKVVLQNCTCNINVCIFFPPVKVLLITCSSCMSLTISSEL